TATPPNAATAAAAFPATGLAPAAPPTGMPCATEPATAPPALFPIGAPPCPRPAAGNPSANANPPSGCAALCALDAATAESPGALPGLLTAPLNCPPEIAAPAAGAG